MGGGGGGHDMPVYKQVVAGAFAGLCEILIMYGFVFLFWYDFLFCCFRYPLDVVKTRFQLTRTANPSIPAAFRNIMEKEGASRLYRGIAAPILAEAPKRAIKFTANEQYKKLLKDSNGGLSVGRASLAGVFAGMTEAVINCPFEVVKVRMQNKDNLNLYRSSGHAAATILRNEGFSALYYGFESMLWRNGIWNGVYFGTINQCRKMMAGSLDVCVFLRVRTLTFAHLVLCRGLCVLLLFCM